MIFHQTLILELLLLKVKLLNTSIISKIESSINELWLDRLKPYKPSALVAMISDGVN